MALSTHHDNFDKLAREAVTAQIECTRAYHIWCDAAARLKRIEEQRHEAWLKLVDASANREAP